MDCYKCYKDLFYSTPWDAYYCPYCNEWNENACNDSMCWFNCCNRPDKPLSEEDHKIYCEKLKDKYEEPS